MVYDSLEAFRQKIASTQDSPHTICDTTKSAQNEHLSEAKTVNFHRERKDRDADLLKMSAQNEDLSEAKTVNFHRERKDRDADLLKMSAQNEDLSAKNAANFQHKRKHRDA